MCRTFRHIYRRRRYLWMGTREKRMTGDSESTGTPALYGMGFILPSLPSVLALHPQDSKLTLHLQWLMTMPNIVYPEDTVRLLRSIRYAFTDRIRGLLALGHAIPSHPETRPPIRLFRGPELQRRRARRRDLVLNPRRTRREASRSTTMDCLVTEIDSVILGQAAGGLVVRGI